MGHRTIQEPDVLVLGFQELDLSTEALLYSTGSAKEDAWTNAVLAGLGEERNTYEKVSLMTPQLQTSRVLKDVLVAGVQTACWYAHSGGRQEQYTRTIYRCADLCGRLRNYGSYGALGCLTARRQSFN